ncbi:hypothetical protein Dsin_012705 [Dipteronia sinensis]|uniref:Endonuclease/exonuclease/phosphatase domain-containing protein n=1 Tax=Dipteronia sinensis TaxID=43782 RepID=A0AAE0AJC4_9ROSI|nr:hypothetical protein Dsin_012705 [Dipteronia sinensis]
MAVGPMSLGKERVISGEKGSMPIDVTTHQQDETTSAAYQQEETANASINYKVLEKDMCDLRTIGNSEIVSGPHSLKQELQAHGPEEHGPTYKPTASIQQTAGLGLPAVSHCGPIMGNKRGAKAEVRCGKRKVELTGQVDVASGRKKARPSGGRHEAIEEISGEVAFRYQQFTVCNDYYVLECSGLGSSQAFNSLLSQKHVVSPDVLFLMETKADHVRMETLRVKLGFFGKLVVNCSGKSGGLCMLWSTNVQVVLLSYSLAHMDVRLASSLDNRWWQLIGFYGNPNANQRSHSWNLLRRLVDMSNLPWVCVGDFNEVLDGAEEIGGVPKDWKLLAGFREALDDCGLDDLGYTGQQFTWCNKREGEAFIQERLDRCVGNLDWQTSFPDFQVSHLDYWHSDHRLIILEFSDNLGATGEANRKQRFHFEECWIDNILAEDIKEIKLELRHAYATIDAGAWRTIQHIESQLDDMLETEERYWRQRSRIEWLKYGDRDTRFFHMKATVRRARNKITGL